MCGFVGVVNFKKKLEPLKFLKEANNLMVSRGPDDEKYFINENCQIGFRRLSILDLSKNASQPMISTDKNYVCVFNGEIYNYREIFKEIENKFIWKSKSDTEVLLNSYIIWGKEVVNKLDGMFSFVIIDLKNKSLFSSRDRFGEKPFFYLNHNDSFFFSSAISSLEKISHLRFKYDQSSVNNFINFGHTQSKKTLYKDVFKLPPANSLIFENNTIKINEYWTPSNEVLNRADLDFFDQIFKKSIQDRLNSDRPIGVFLSSGIDSSLIAHHANQIESNIKTFSIGFKNKNYDESQLAKKFSRHLGTNHYEKIIDEKDMLNVILNKNNYLDEPIADPSLIPTILLTNFAKENGVDVCLSGDGGDELFGGYNYYTLMKLKLILLKLPNTFSSLINLIASLSNSHKMILLNKFLNFKDIKKSFLFLKKLNKDFDNVFESTNNELDLETFEKYYSTDQMNNIFNYDMRNNLIENFLVKLDRSSMTTSLECRLPFLSKNVVNFSLNIPTSKKVSLINKKIFLKNYSKRYLPEFIINKKKRGFHIPIKEWLRKDLFNWSKDLIYDDNNYSDLSINKSKVINLFNTHQSKKRDAHPYLWSILMLLQFNRGRNN